MRMEAKKLHSATKIAEFFASIKPKRLSELKKFPKFNSCNFRPFKTSKKK